MVITFTLSATAEPKGKCAMLSEEQEEELYILLDKLAGILITEGLTNIRYKWEEKGE